MGTTNTSEVDHGLKLASLQETLIKECRVMLDHALTNGKTLDPKQIAPLEKADKELTSSELLPVYNYLLLLVKPAKPGTLILFEKNRQSTSRFKFLGPLPIIRKFMLLAILSLFALIGFSLSPDVNATSIELSMLQGSGWDQVLRLGFLLSAASVGASFYALFRMNTFINQGTFDMKYTSSYWVRYVVGLVAGILLSELFVAFINPETIVTVDKHISGDVGLSEEGILSTTRYLLKPILAILGGFSANLVYRILNRLVESIESIFKGSAEEQMKRKESEVLSQSQDALNQVKSSTANQILGIKNELLNHGVAPEVLQGLDSITGSLVPTMATSAVHSVLSNKEPEKTEEDTTSQAGAPEPAKTEEAAPEEEAPAAETPDTAPPSDDEEKDTPPPANW